MKKNIRRTSIAEKGITLIALVVTIIILSILAGITLNLVVSNNGLIKKSEQGAALYEKSGVEEGISNLFMQYMIDRETGNIEESFDEYAKANGINDAEKYEDEYEIEYKGYVFTINGNTLEIINTEKVGPSASLLYVGVIDPNTGATVTEKRKEGTELKIQVKAIVDEGATIENVKGPNGITLNESNEIYTSSNTITENGTYTFKITYKVGEKTKTKNVPIIINNYKISYIGKFVKYEPDNSTYSKDLLGDNYTGSSRYNASDLKTEEYTDGWQIMNYNEETGEMTIVMAQPTTKTLDLYGARGYNNGVDVLNDVCANLFSKKTDGWDVTARSMKIEDIEDMLTETEKAKKYEQSEYDDIQYNETKTYSDSNKGAWSSNRKYPKLYAREKGSGTDGTGDVKETGLGLSERNPNVSYGTWDTQVTEAPTKLTVTQTEYGLWWNESWNDENLKDEDYLKILMLNNSSGQYWLASRFVGCGEEYATFGLMKACMDGLRNHGMYMSVYKQGDDYDGIRAVVNLGTVKIVGDETGADKDNAITISK